MAQQPFSRSYRLTNYLSLALVILVAIAALFVLIHVVIIGVVIAAVVFAFGYIKNRLVKPKPTDNQKQFGRTIDHDE